MPRPMSLMPSNNVPDSNKDDRLIESSFSSTSRNVLYKELRRIEKLVTALFLVTEHIKDTDYVRKHVRDTVLELLDIGHVPYDYDPANLVNRLNYILSHIDSLMSFITVARSIGYVSDTNASLLIRELLSLHTHLAGRSDTLKEKIRESIKKNIEQDIDISSILTSDTSSDAQTSSAYSSSFYTRPNDTKNSNRQAPLKDTHNTSSRTSANLKDNQTPVTDTLKDSYKGQILDIIKDMGEVTIKDIASRIIKCSEKTLQRYLQDLMNENKIVKVGVKRWSKYRLV
jgi:hypothetical protein